MTMVCGTPPGPGLLAAEHCRHAGNHCSAVHAGGGSAHCRVHPSIEHRFDRRGHGIYATNKDVRAVVGLHDVISRQGHIIVMEERRVDFWTLVEPRLPNPRRLCHVPVRRGSILPQYSAARFP